MPLTDNMLLKVIPASGDTFIKNLIDGSNCAANGSGTITLDTVNKAWRVQGLRDGTFINAATGYENAAISVAIRFRANSRLDDFSEYVRVVTGTGSAYGATVGNTGTSTGALRVREAIAGSGHTQIGTPTYTTGNWFTVVFRLCDNGFSPFTDAAWIKQTSRANNNPDYSVSSVSAGRDAFGPVDTLVLGATGQDITISHIAMWQRALTDAEAAAVADDIDGQLNPVTGVTVNGLVGNAVADGSTTIINLAVIVAGQVANVSANGSTATITNSADTLIVAAKGDATANGNVANVSLNRIISALVGDVIASGSLASITNTTQFVTDTLINNTGTILGSQPVYWTWLINGRVGSLNSVSLIDGTGTTAANGKLTINGLPLGNGVLLISVRNTSAEDDFVYYEAGTVV